MNGTGEQSKDAQRSNVIIGIMTIMTTTTTTMAGAAAVAAVAAADDDDDGRRRKRRRRSTSGDSLILLVHSLDNFSSLSCRLLCSVVRFFVHAYAVNEHRSRQKRTPGASAATSMATTTRSAKSGAGTALECL